MADGDGNRADATQAQREVFHPPSVTNETVEIPANATSQRDENLAVIEISTLFAIFLLAVISNLVMMIAIMRQRRNRPLSRM